MSVHIDRTSLLAEVDAAAILSDVESALRATGLTLDIDVASHALSVGEWLADGGRGARDAWLDPADHLVAGFEALLPNGETLTVRPAPRRAVGPDLTALVVGARGRFARLLRAWVRVHPLGVERPKGAPFVAERDPPVTPGETSLLDAIAKEMQRPG